MTSENETGRRPGRLYRTLVSIKTSLVFLCVFALLFFLGTVFPQSSDPDRLEQYREAGGKFIGLVDALDLLNIFRSWYFGVITLVFAVHLLLCLIHRLGTLRRRPSIRRFTREDLLRRDYSFSVIRPLDTSVPDAEKVLRRIGFRRRKYYSEDARIRRIVCEKGLPFRWLSWMYHVCMLVCLVGFGLSYLFAFEDYLAIGVGETEQVALRPADTNWRKLMRLLDRAEPPEAPKIEIALEGFITEYTEKTKLVYPNKTEPTQRFLAALGMADESVRYEMPEDPLYPRDWFSALAVYRGGRLVKRKKIEVNDPLRYGGLTFYQIGYEYRFDLGVGEETIEGIEAGKPFAIPQMEGEFRIRNLRLGMVFGYDGSAEKLTPSAKLQHRPPSNDEKPPWSTAGELLIGEPAEIMHAEMTLDNLRQSSILSYRYDPGVPLLWVAGMGLVVLMAARVYLPWYQLRCHVESSDERTRFAISIRMMGLFARPTRLRRKLSDALLK